MAKSILNLDVIARDLHGVCILPTHAGNACVLGELIDGYDGTLSSNYRSGLGDVYAPDYDAEVFGAINAVLRMMAPSTDGLYYDRVEVRSLCAWSGLARAEKPGYVKVWLTKRDRVERRPKTEIKLGKWLRRFVNPKFESDIEVAVNEIKKNLVAADDPRFVFKYGETAKTFRRVYTESHISGFASFQSHAFSNLPGSCMRYGVNHWDTGGVHPAEAYASGDFVICWIEDSETGEIGARVIMTRDAEALSPVYAVADTFGRRLLREVANEFEVDPNEMSECFEGYALRAIEHYGRFVCPYLDCRSRVAYDGGGYLEIVSDYDHEAQETSTTGYVEFIVREMCERCERDVCEDDIRYVDSVEMLVCDDCVHQAFTRSDYSGDLIPDDDIVVINCGAGRFMDVASSELEDIAFMCDEDQDWWHIDTMVETECGYTVSSEAYGIVCMHGGYYIFNSEEYWEARREHQPHLTEAA